MLWKQPKLADVSQAQNYMSVTTAKAIWDYLRVQISGRNKFYYDDQHGDRVRSGFHLSEQEWCG
jgi:hypothetical protein